eukprot:TRINITY_DN2364_c0_g1_i1.p1 TRINITY_DN2364_c0_g1~~TRINITY_DN2364_c0_g1_i1.p1  ORF type:complete len:346 (-),score=15.25 TRINITY_DN2364_c0_g1_i1:151-1062(-)
MRFEEDREVLVGEEGMSTDLGCNSLCVTCKRSNKKIFFSRERSWSQLVGDGVRGIGYGAAGTVAAAASGPAGLFVGPAVTLGLLAADESGEAYRGSDTLICPNVEISLRVAQDLPFEEFFRSQYRRKFLPFCQSIMMFFDGLENNSNLEQCLRMTEFCGRSGPEKIEDDDSKDSCIDSEASEHYQNASINAYRPQRAGSGLYRKEMQASNPSFNRNRSYGEMQASRGPRSRSYSREMQPSTGRSSRRTREFDGDGNMSYSRQMQASSRPRGDMQLSRGRSSRRTREFDGERPPYKRERSRSSG